MYIKRHIEPVVSRISKRKPVLVLTGARQVGKSTMLREVYHDIKGAYSEAAHRQSSMSGIFQGGLIPFRRFWKGEALEEAPGNG